MKNNQCAKCGSKEIMESVEVRDQEHLGVTTLKVSVSEPKPPDSGFFWTPRSAQGSLRAWICASCGFTELYAGNLEKLYEIYGKGR